MNRIIRRIQRMATFYNAINIFGKTVEVFINPSKSEMSDIEGIDSYGIRIFIKEDGTIYGWQGETLHSKMEKSLPEIVSPIHGVINGTDIVLYLKPEVNDINYLVNTIKAAKLNLKALNINNSSRVSIECGYYGAPELPEYATMKTMNDILNFGEGFFKKLLKK